MPFIRLSDGNLLDTLRLINWNAGLALLNGFKRILIGDCIALAHDVIARLQLDVHVKNPFVRNSPRLQFVQYFRGFLFLSALATYLIARVV